MLAMACCLAGEPTFLAERGSASEEPCIHLANPLQLERAFVVTSEPSN